jgi:ribonuclease E
VHAAQAGIPLHSVEAQIEEHEEEEEETAAPLHAVEGPGALPGSGRRRRRRRRRRGRGHGAEGALPGAPPSQVVPDRHIFRVGADGSAEPTGQTAPREPVRAIAPWNRKAQPPAVEPPPPHLRAPEENAKPTKPARRRRSAVAEQPVMGGELPASRTAALPAPEAETPAKPKRTRKKAAAEPVVATEEKPKRGRKKAETAAVVAEAQAKPKRPRKKSASAEASETGEAGVKKTRSTRKAAGTTKTATRKKKTT